MPLRILRRYEECGETRWPTTVCGLKRLWVRYGPHLNVCFWHIADFRFPVTCWREPMGEMNILLGFFLGWVPLEHLNTETARIHDRCWPP